MPEKKEILKIKPNRFKKIKNRKVSCRNVYKELNEISFKIGLERLATFYISSKGKNKKSNAA